MDEKYDAVVLGTGMVECVISGLLSVCGNKVLHTDRNPYYGGESTSMNLKDLYAKFDRGEPPAKYGSSRDWNIDLILKLIMSEDHLVKMFRCSKVYNYLSFLQIDGSYISRDNKLYKVPATEKEVLTSPLLGLFQKKNLYSFVTSLSKCDLSKDQTPSGLHPTNSTMAQAYEKFGINAENQVLIGHALSLYQNDDYIHQPCMQTFKRMELYRTSLEAYGKSPYIYPEYGLAEIPQAFARLSAVYGGTYMLSTGASGFETDENGVLTGVQFGDKVVKTNMVIGDPSYFPSKVKSTKKVVRCICIIDHNVKGVSNCESCQIIMPSSQLKRHSDIYISVISHKFKICPQGFSVAIVATNLESPNPEADIAPGLKLIEPILEKFVTVSDVYEPTDDGRSSKMFISRSYDATTHFESSCANIHDLWKRITNEEFDHIKFAEKTKAHEPQGS